MFTRLGLRFLPVILLELTSAIAVSSLDFGNDVAPILEQNCLSCHNADLNKGDLDLSTRSTALSLEGIILPGSPDASQLIKVVSGPSPEMPSKAEPLTKEQISTLKNWIAAGATWPEGRVLKDNPKRDLDWWSLQPISKPDSTTLLGSHPIDGFIEKKLAEKQLTPVPQADPLTLVRRVYYDLTGLPPSPEDIDQFLTNKDWNALIDRLLASPAYGEKIAQHWLDLARYAETHGYDKDKPRNQAWPYRDYVIQSFNRDKPFTRFVREQVAGDVIYPNTPEGITALGFLAAGPWDFIGHWEVGEQKLDGRIAKHLDRDELVSAVFNIFQSTTVQCAQCHHHKFDPIRMEDYYRLHAVFAAIDRADRVYEGLSPDQQRIRNDLVAKITNLKKGQESLTSQINRLVAAKASGLDRQIAELRRKYGTGSKLRPQYGYHSSIEKRSDVQKWVQVDIGRARMATEIQLIPAFDNYNNIGAGFGFPVRYRVEVSMDGAFKKDVRVIKDATDADQPNPGNQSIRLGVDGHPFRFVRVTATKLAHRKNDYIFALGEIEILNEGASENFARKGTVSAKDSIESGIRWGRSNLIDSIYFRELNNPEAASKLATLEKERKAIEKSLRPPGSDQRLAEISAQLKKLEAEVKRFPKGKMVYAAATHFPRGGRFTATEGKPRPIHYLHRGDLRSPGDAMTPGVPPLWHGVDPIFFSGSSDWKEGKARAELALHLTRDDNPLFWRSIANRVWQWVFGTPLVGTPNDFGRGGMQPTHPELLDFLAASLRDDRDHSIKSLIRLMVTSRTYQRSSQYHAENAAIDGNNAYRWRANRRRLTAEEMRDSLLSITGALDRHMGGPSFKDFVIEKPQHSPHYEYHLHDPNDPKSHRRTVYRFVVRSQPNPMLTSLDCADPSMSVPQRDESTTALQALTQWNHRFVETMSERMAEHLRQNAPKSPSERVFFACKATLGREPKTTEQSILIEHLNHHGAASLARVLFNMNAFVYVD